MIVEGRVLNRATVRRMLRRGLERRADRLKRSMAHCCAGGRALRPADLARLAAIRAEVEAFQDLVERFEAGQPVPLSPLVGLWCGALPDTIEGAG